MVIKRYGGESLSTYLFGLKKLPIIEFFNIAIQLTNQVQLFHSCNIIHCDIKPQNIVINEQKVTKFIDFGSSSIVSNNNPSFKTLYPIGTFSYMR